MPKIHRNTLPDGRIRYWFRVDVGRGPDGKRLQEHRTFDRRKDAELALARIQDKTGQGAYVRPSRETLGEHLDGYLEGATRNLRASTRRNYEDALLPVRERLGGRYLQGITKADVEGLVTWMLACGRRRGGKAGTGLSARSVRLTLGRLTAALEIGRRGGQARPQPGPVREAAGARPARAGDVDRGRGARSSWPSPMLTGWRRAGGCRCTGCAAARSSACGGATST